MPGTTNLATLSNTASSVVPTDLLHLSQSGIDKKLPLSVLYASIVAAYPLSQAAWSVTTAAFTQPAVGSNVSIPVVNSQWMAVGQSIYVSGGGNYQVMSLPSSTTVLAKNLGTTGSATAGTTVSNGAGVAASGLPGPVGATGSSSLTTVTASFTMPAIGASVTVPVGTSTWMSLNQPVYVGSAGFFTVGAIYSGVSIALTNAGVTGNAAPGTVIATGQNLTAAGAQGAPGAAGPAGGVSGGTLTGALNAAPPDTLASAPTVSIGAAASNIVTITGTTPITAFDAIAAGAERETVFAGVLLLTNSTAMQLPGGANITTAAGDIARWRSLGSGMWVMTSYTRSNGQALVVAPSGRNFVINGLMRQVQRGTSFSLTTTPTYTLDRWAAFVAAGTAAATLSQVSAGLTGYAYAAKLQRTAGSNNSYAIVAVQALESSDSIPLAGKTVTISGRIKVGANYSGSNAYLSLITGTGIDQPVSGIYSGSWAGWAQSALTLTGLSTTWQQFSQVVAIPAGTTQIGLGTWFIPTGTAGADDSLYFNDVRIDVGSIPGTSDAPSIAAETATCRRYTQVYATAQNASDLAYQMRATPTQSGSGPYVYSAEL